MKTLITSLCLLPLTAHAIPFSEPHYYDLTTTPLITIVDRTIDFAPFTELEFMNFAPRIWPHEEGWHLIMGSYARDGLVNITGSFPSSFDSTFTNSLPSFDFATTELILFSLLIAGSNTPFVIHTWDADGDERLASFSTPSPEPTSLALMAAGLLLALRRRFV